LPIIELNITSKPIYNPCELVVLVGGQSRNQSANQGELWERFAKEDILFAK
jgi:hypothetical protein